MTKARIIADYAGTGASTDLATQTELDAAKTALGFQSVPHIIPGVLYPAVAGKDLSGTALGGSYTYGTAHTDGRSYYYTDIKGSKPIKDPRIGGHFGSQRHKFKSLQLLEQETATHGENVYSVDGREWVRVGPNWEIYNNDDGNFLFQTTSTTSFIEITGYFNDINFINKTETSRFDDVDITVNGAVGHTGNTTIAGRATVGSPLGARYVDSGSVINGGSTLSTALGTVPAINTIKLIPTNVSSEKWYLYGIELIAQDTTSTANKSKIQIPSQNVVSYGKKFTVSGTPHYDPFNGFTSGNLAAVQALIDTDTSLGMANWLSSSTYYRPFNGGRVVKWVDSSGNIKTSVTMMPPNAQNINGTASNAHTLGNANDQTINFDTTTIANATPLSEVAKTYYWREFGNGSANGGTGSGSYPDFSMHINNDSTEDDMAYVMDDGLTSLIGKGSHTTSSSSPHNITSGGDAKGFHFTFIGTGITLKTTGAGAGTRTMAINLPYGTHIYKHFRDGDATPDGTIDGVALADIAGNTYSAWEEVTFHQPKKPPIPEDAVVLCDFMLMADFVPTTGYGMDKVSKGTRWVSCSRDWFYDSGATVTLAPVTVASNGFRVYNNNATKDWKLPFFGNGIMIKHNVETGRSSDTTFKINSAAYGTGFSASGNYVAGNRVGSSHNTGGWDTSNNDGTYTISQQTNGANSEEFTGVKGLDLRVNEFWLDDNAATYYTLSGAEIATPIHTSSHYQSFETPFLHELVGGDRNMEQTNLVVTPDGKSWDEVTRDTSYIGNGKLQITRDGGDGSDSDEDFIFDFFRGTKPGKIHMIQKDFAISYDRVICLKAGEYDVKWDTIARTGGVQGQSRMFLNGEEIRRAEIAQPSAGRGQADIRFTLCLNRGDYLEIRAGNDLEGNQDAFLCYLRINKG